MITAIEIKERMDAQPFKPFRLCLSGGKSYDITNPASVSKLIGH
jgi:hypothetical protein